MDVLFAEHHLQEMRTLLTTHSSTKAERRFHELLKRLRIPFRPKVIINGREVDFLIKRYAIDIDGHAQDVEKNRMLVQEGYNPIHLENKDIPSEALVEWLIQSIKNTYGDSHYHRRGPHRGLPPPVDSGIVGQRG